MEKKSFHQLLGMAWQLSRSSRTLWLFGFFIALTPLLSNLVLTHFFPGLTEENWRAILSAVSPDSFFLLTLFLILIFLVRIFGKSSLTVALPLALPQAKAPFNFKTLNSRKLLLSWRHAVSLEVATFFFLVLLAAILSFPAVFSYFHKPTAFSTLALFSGAAFLVLFLLTLFVKELALFYLLLSKLSIRASFENAYSLFVRFFPRCLAFGVYALAVLLLFTFCLDLFILTSGEVFHFSRFVSLAFSIFFLTWFSILYRALWFFFFRDLATPAVPVEASGEKQKVLLEEKIPETPSV